MLPRRVWGNKQAGRHYEEESELADSAAETLKDSIPDPTDAIKDKAKDALQSDDDNALIAPLKKAAIAAALAALTPVVKDAVTNLAEGAVKKAPEMFENAGGMEGITDFAKDKLGEGGGMGKVASFAMDKLGGGGDGGGMLSGALGALTGGALGGDDSDGGSSPPDGVGNNRRMPVQQAVDVAAPLSVVYNQFTQFEEWTNFVFRVPSVHQEDEANLKFKTKQWNFGREWEAEIIDQRPDERILWQSTSGLSLTGVTTFHELAPRLTRVEVNIDFDPAGLFEKIGRGWRFAKRTIRADLHRFKAYVEMNEVEDGEWRGYIKDGEVVSEQDYYGKEMAAGAEGALVDEEGNPVELDEEGNLVDEQGEPVALDEEGNPLAFDEAGHRVVFDEDGNLIAVDEEGNPVAAEEDLEEEPLAEEDLEEEEIEEEPISEQDLDEEDIDDDEAVVDLDAEEETEYVPVDEEGLDEEQVTEGDEDSEEQDSASASPSKSRASKNGSSKSSRAKSSRTKSSSSKSSGGGRSRGSSSDGAKASSSGAGNGCSGARR